MLARCSNRCFEMSHTVPPLFARAAFCLVRADTRCSSFIFLASASRSFSSRALLATSRLSILLSSSAFLHRSSSSRLSPSVKVST